MRWSCEASHKTTQLMSLARLALWCCLFTMLSPLQAHEFWFAPIASPQTVGGTVTLRLEVGELFTGEAAGISIPTTQALRHFFAREHEDLRPYLPPVALEAEVDLAVDAPDMHLLTYDSTPQRITLAAEKFHTYLHDEGLDSIRRQREQAGTADQPGRERYRRHIKTLFQVGSATDTKNSGDAVYATAVGQRLEIMPLHNPLLLAPGDALPVKIVFDQQPLVGALVKAWHKHNGQLLLIRATTSATGEVTLNLPYAGDWMVSVVHMVPAMGEPGVDWDSFWGNLSFHMFGHP